MQEGRVVRGNTVPPGGPVSPVVSGIVGGGMLLPDTIQIQEMADVFFENSEQNYLILNQVALTPGRQTQFLLQNVGLGEGLELLVTGSFELRNAHATLARTVTIAPEFPFNVLSNVQVMFNGKVALVNASGYDLLRMMLKRNYRNTFMDSFQSGRSPVAQYMRVDKRIANINIAAHTGTVGTLVTGETLTGFSAVTLPANSTSTITFELYLDISFVLRKDLPFGLIPMQHNAIYANVTLNTPMLVSTSHETPLRSPAAEIADISIINPVINCLPTYNFWGLPQNPELFNFFVNNSYVLTTYPKNPIGSVGSRALAFNFPLNYWLISAMFTIRDAADLLVNVRNAVNFPVLVYNGTIHVDRSDIRSRIAREIVHTGRQYPYGTLLFDGAQTNNQDGNSANMSRWLNMYQANNPQYFADIITPFTLPGTYDVLLEQLIPNYVTIL